MPSPLAALVADLADSFEAISFRLRQFVDEDQVQASRDSELPFADRIIDAARRFHVTIGPRQLEAVRLIAAAHPEGVSTRQLMRHMHIEQPNVYLTLKSLVERNHKLLWKDATSSPQLYHLSDALLLEAGASPSQSES